MFEKNTIQNPRDQKILKDYVILQVVTIRHVERSHLKKKGSTYSIFPKQTLMCNTIVNKFLFAAICLVLDWIQSNQSGFPLKVAKKLSDIFLGPSLAR